MPRREWRQTLAAGHYIKSILLTNQIKMATFYHRTSIAAAQSIIATGFRDALGMGGLVEGVWISDRPLDPNEGTKTGEALLSVMIAARGFSKYEVREEGKPYREWCVPARLLKKGVVQLLEIEDSRASRIKGIRARAEARAIQRMDTALHEAGHAVMHVFLGLDNCDDVHIIPGAGTLGAFSSRKSSFHLAGVEGDMGRRARVECRKHLLVAWAGPEAALRAPRLWGSDKTLAKLVAKMVAPKRETNLIRCYQLRARGIIKRRLAAVIQEFALLLLEQKRIEGLKAERIICGQLGIEVGHAWPQARLDRQKARRQRAQHDV